MPTDVQPEQLNELFRQNIRQRREDLGLSQNELAERMTKRRRGKIKVHGPYISALESGARVPLVGMLAELADALETTPDALLSKPEKISA